MNFGSPLAALKFKRIGAYFWSAWVTGAFTRKRADGSLHGKGFTLKHAEGSLHGEGCLQDVQTALCTSAIRWCVNLYTYIGPKVPVCSEWYVLVPF